LKCCQKKPEMRPILLDVGLSYEQHMGAD
jgi:hypothetical protein